MRKIEVMMFIKVFLFTVFVIGIELSNVQAQEEAQVSMNTSCLIHLDKGFYVSGETIWYKAYFPLSLQQSGAILKMSLSDKNGKILKSHYIKMGEEGDLSGYFTIPISWSSDIYHLILSGTAENGRRFLQLTDIPLPIYNDKNIPDTPSAKTEGERLSRVWSPRLSIELGNVKIQTRDEAQLLIKLADNNGNAINGNASISVRDKSLLAYQSPQFENVFQGFSLSNGIQLDSNVYLQANLVDSLNRLVFSGTLVAYEANSENILIPETDGIGNFWLQLPEYYGQKRLQWLDAKNPNAEVKIKETVRIVSKPSLEYTPEVIQYLRFSQERKKLYQIMGSIENQLDLETPIFEWQKIEPDRKFLTADYEPFTSLPTFFQEILTPLKARRTNKGIVYKMLNTDVRYKSFYPDQPIFIVNQYVITDSKVIDKLEYQKIESIEIFNEYKKLVSEFGGLGLNGVVKIQTRQDLSFLEETIHNTFDVNVFLPPANFTSKDNASPSTPNVRPLVYWSPQVRIDGTQTYSFFHSDDLGDFEIEVVVQDKNGDFYRKIQTYTVER